MAGGKEHQVYNHSQKATGTVQVTVGLTSDSITHQFFKLGKLTKIF
jgi:hypothetical protein